jgi:hypothetical protein
LTEYKGEQSSGKDSKTGVRGVFRADCVSRRLGILDGMPFEAVKADDAGKLHTSKRTNINFGLLSPNPFVKDL